SKGVQDYERCITGKGHHLAEKLQIHTARGGVVRKVEDQHLGAWPVLLVRLLQVVEELIGGAKRQVQDVPISKDRPVDVDGVGRGRHHDHIARVDRRPHEMRKAFLDPNGGDYFAVMVELDSKTPPVVIGDGEAQLGNPTRGRIAVIAGVLGRLTELVDDRLRWRIIRIAHTKINDILTSSPRLHLQLINDGKYIGWQTI